MTETELKALDLCLSYDVDFDEDTTQYKIVLAVFEAFKHYSHMDCYIADNYTVSVRLFGKGYSPGGNPFSLAVPLFDYNERQLEKVKSFINLAAKYEMTFINVFGTLLQAEFSFVDTDPGFRQRALAELRGIGAISKRVGDTYQLAF